MRDKVLERYFTSRDNTEIVCLIFDFDGTLAETEEAHRKAFNLAFSTNKLKWYWDKHIYKKLLQVAGGKERIIFFNENFLSKPHQIRGEDIEELYFQKAKLFSQSVSRGFFKLRPGVKKLLEKARYKKKISYRYFN